MVDENCTFRTRLKEINKKADLQASGHSFVAAKYSGKATFYSLLIVISSLFLLMFCWVQDSWLITLGKTVGLSLTADLIKFFLGLAAFLNMALTVWDLVDEPRTKKELHLKAAKHYTESKYQINKILESGIEITDQLYESLTDEYLDTPVSLSERDFLATKKHHLVKKHLSKILDERPHAWLWCLRIQYWCRDTFCKKGMFSEQQRK